MAIDETKNNGANAASVYPSPNDGHFSVTLPNNLTEGTILEIYNVSGKLIYKETLHSTNTKVDLSNNAKGVYFYKLVFSLTKESLNGKLVID